MAAAGSGGRARGVVYRPGFGHAQVRSIPGADAGVSGDLAGRLLSRPDFAEEEDREDGQIVWWAKRVDLIAPDDEAERWGLGVAGSRDA